MIDPLGARLRSVTAACVCLVVSACSSQPVVLLATDRGRYVAAGTHLLEIPAACLRSAAVELADGAPEVVRTQPLWVSTEIDYAPGPRSLGAIDAPSRAALLRAVKDAWRAPVSDWPTSSHMYSVHATVCTDALRWPEERHYLVLELSGINGHVLTVATPFDER